MRSGGADDGVRTDAGSAITAAGHGGEPRDRAPAGVSRREALRALAGVASLPAICAAFDADAAPLSYNLSPQPIGDGVWLIRGAQEPIDRQNGGAIANVVIFSSSEGAVVIDTGPSKRYGLELASAAERLTGQPVVRVYITHFHPDHVFGNQAFPAQSLAAPQGVVDGLESLGEDFAAAMYYTAGDWMRGTEVVRPTRIVTSGTEAFGGRRFNLLTLAGHTNSDLAVFEENSGILVAGDLAFLDRAPTTPHADLATWRTSLTSLSTIEHRLLVPGHGPAEDGRRAFVQTRDWLDVIEAKIRGAFDRGLSMTEAIGEPLPAWTEKVALARYEYERSVMHFYPKLEAGGWPRVDEKR
ncbi:MAG: quinoprotein relay system zinc metallohydrolase 1 [Hyphomicrobiaceae bacterium]|nr:quinoprotein relay system zinc metallohydrolase 1 [Hyphomicrobiaceae bacterium]